jgi:hypothetical protein
MVEEMYWHIIDDNRYLLAVTILNESVRGRRKISVSVFYQFEFGGNIFLSFDRWVPYTS